MSRAKGPLADAMKPGFEEATPAVLLPYQQEWISDSSELKVAEKSRRVGLTWAEAADNVLTAACNQKDGGQNVYYIGYNKDMAIEYIDACALWAKVFNRAAGAIEEGEEIFRDEKDEEQRIKTYTIRFPSDFRIVALSSRPANLRGKQGVVVIDEAAFHNDLDELIKSAMALLIWGGKVRIISTHDGDNNPFNELIMEIRAGKRSGSVHRIEFQQAVAQGLHKRVCMRLRKAWSPEVEAAWVAAVYKFYGDDATEELDVVPSAGEGAYLTRAQIVATQRDHIPVLRWAVSDAFALMPKALRKAECKEWCERVLKPELDKLDKRRSHFFGSDFARKVDLSAMWPVAEQQDCSLHTPFLIELRKVPYEQQKQVLFYLVHGLPNFRGGAMDATGNGGYLAEVAQQEFGALRIHAVTLNASWYLEHMPRLKAAFEDQTITTPADADVLGDIRGIKKVGGYAKVPDNHSTVGADGFQRHGDTAVALALAMYAVEKIDIGPIEFTAVPARTRGFDTSQSRSDDDLPSLEPETQW